MQVDGELVDAPADVTVDVLPRALTVLVPKG
jgi:diacylglycerol kinase family enzyme